MPKVIGSSSGNNLQITIPVRGEKNWDELIENSCFQRISDHSHTGNGDGAKIDTDALEDNAVTAAKITDGSVSNAKLDSATQTSIGTISTNTSNIATNTSNIATNTSNISTNTSNISTNTSNISTNTTNIASNTNRVLSSISDVSTSSPSNGEVLAYNSTSGEWEPSTSAGGASALNDLSDVTITGTPSNDSFLRYDSASSAFKNESVNIVSALNDLSNVNANPSGGQFLRWNGSNSWYASTPDFANLADVNLTSPSDGQTLQFVQVGPDLELQNVAAGGGGVDTITNATDASNYSGTNNIVLITSTSDVEFTNNYEDKIFYCTTDIKIRFSSLTLKNVTVVHTTTAAGKFLELWHPNQGTTSGSGSVYYTNCNFRSNFINIKLGLLDAYDEMNMTSDIFLPTYFVACDLKCMYMDIEQSNLSGGGNPRASLMGFFTGAECRFHAGTTVKGWRLTHQAYTGVEQGSNYTYLPEIYANHSSIVMFTEAKSQTGGTTMTTSPTSGVLPGFSANLGGRIIIQEGTGSTSNSYLWVNNIKGDADLRYKRLEFTGASCETRHNPAEVDLASNQALSGTSFTKINFDIQNPSGDKMWDSVNGRWEIPATQQYELQLYLVLTGVDSAAQVEVKHGLNGATQTKVFPYVPYTGGTTRVLSTSRLFNFSANQTVDLHVSLSTGTASVSTESFAILRPVKQFT